MPELKFSARTHPELVRQVRDWLATSGGERSMTDVITESSELTKDALRIIAAAAPAPVAESELLKTLTKLGYRATDLTRATLIAGLDSVSGFDDIAIVPSRRTRDPEDVDISWQLDAYKFELPLLAAAMDGVVSPATAIEIGRLGGCGVLNLEGLWTRYEDADSILEDIANSP